MGAINAGRLEPYKNSLGGIKNIYLFNYISYKKYEIEVSESELLSFPETTIYKYETRSDSNTFSEDLEINDEGISYNQSLSVQLKVNYYDEKVTSNLLSKEVGVIIEKYDGKTQILGTYNGLTVDSVNIVSGGSKTDFNGYNLQITGKELCSALFIENLDDVGFIIDGEQSGYLLDDYTAPIGYSLRRLRASSLYSVRLRRPSDNEETNVLLTDSGQMDGNSIVSVGGILSDWATAEVISVVTIYNQGTGGSTYDMTQSTAGTQPILSSTYDYVDFNGGNYSLKASTFANYTQGSLFSLWDTVGAGSFVMSLEHSSPAVALNFRMSHYATTAGANDTINLFLSSPSYRMNEGTTNGTFENVVLGMLSSNGSRTIGALNTNTPAAVDENVGTDSGLWFAQTATSGFTLGMGAKISTAPFYGTGKFIEVLLYDVEPTGADITEIQTNIVNEYSL